MQTPKPRPNAEQIKLFCHERFINPAFLRGDFSVTVRTGTVREALADAGFERPELPAVCSALGSNAFEAEYGIRRIHVEGPLNGANTYLTFLLLGNIK